MRRIPFPRAQRPSRRRTPRPRTTTTAETGPQPGAGSVGVQAAARGGRFPALASPTYRRFIVAAFIGSIGNWMQATALRWLVLGLTDSRFALGATSAAATAPILLLSIFAGVLADRVDLRRLLAATQLAAAAVVAILAILTSTGVVAFWQVLVLAALSGAAGALATPAFQAVVSTIVDRSAMGSPSPSTRPSSTCPASWVRRSPALSSPRAASPWRSGPTPWGS